MVDFVFDWGDLFIISWGGSVQLFHFDVHEDVRTIADATIEKDEVHFIPALSLSISYIL